jgi:transposase
MQKKYDEFGYFYFITSDKSIPANYLIGIYKKRDVIEKAFDNFKNNIDFRRIRTQKNETTEGKFFVGFLSLILRTALMNKICADKNYNKFPVEKIIKQMNLYRKIIIEKKVFFTTLSKSQKNIFRAIGLFNLPQSNITEQIFLSKYKQ